jgi:hypothetical protein
MCTKLDIWVFIQVNTKLKWQSRIYNPETLATEGAQTQDNTQHNTWIPAETGDGR